MSKQIVIDWQKSGLLVANCSVRGGVFTLDAVSHQAISEDSELGAENASKALGKAVQELGLGKTDVVVVASREIVEVRTLSVPRVDSSELPDIIRFQAQRQLANMGDAWKLDFVMLPDDPSQEMQTALVGAISPTHLAEIESACSAANLSVSQVALRSLEIVRYALASGHVAQTGASLIVCLSEQHADLLILKAGNVILVRGTKLPSEIEHLPTVLSGEVKRSMMAASAQLGDMPIESTLLFASPDLAARVEQGIADAVGMAMTVVDPVTLLAPSIASRGELAHSSANRIAAVAGAGLLATADKRSTLDFKNPKKRPPKKKNTGRLVLAASAAVLALVAGVSWWITTNRALDEELAMYEQEIEGKKDLVLLAQEKVKELSEIEKFLAGSPNYLDELTYVAQRIPPADKVILAGPTFSTLGDGRGQIRVAIATDSASTVSEFEDSIRDEYHSAQGSDNRQSERPTDLYKWEAVETITVSGRGWEPLKDAASSPSQGQSPESKDNGEGETQEPPPEIEESVEAPPVPDENKRAGSKSASPENAAA